MFLRRNFSCLKNISAQINMNEIDNLMQITRNFIPNLATNKHKGQNGKIGIIGGSLEYCGAPYFAGISALRVGADLAHIFCSKEASIPIKSFSPDLIVHPVLNDADALKLIVPWLQNLHVILIGPGLGRDKEIFETVTKLIEQCRALSKPLVIDADGLFLICQSTQLVKNYPGLILTPNHQEFSRLVKAFLNKTVDLTSNIEEALVKELAQSIGDKVVVLCKGSADVISHGSKDVPTLVCRTVGSGRRCGGQGDLLAGSLSVLSYWAMNNSAEGVTPSTTACYAACTLIRECNATAFKVNGRGMLASDMINEIVPTFARLFEVHS